MKSWSKMPPRERKRAVVNRAFEMTKALLYPTMRIRRSRRGDVAACGHKITAHITCCGKNDGYCSWPNENSFLFGGHGIMSVFSFINEYLDNAYDDVWARAARKLTRFTVFSKYKSAEELVLAIEIAGETHK